MLNKFTFTDMKFIFISYRRGDPACCEEIKNFVIQHNIKQQQVAVLAGMSQSYVSRYLKGDFLDMSEKSRRTMLKWYLTFRKNPAAIGMQSRESKFYHIFHCIGLNFKTKLILSTKNIFNLVV